MLFYDHLFRGAIHVTRRLYVQTRKLALLFGTIHKSIEARTLSLVPARLKGTMSPYIVDVQFVHAWMRVYVCVLFVFL
jgi:hypothetical protein